MTTMRSPNLDADSIHATVMRAMLRRPREAWATVGIARRVGISLDEAVRILLFLQQRGFVKRSPASAMRRGWMLTSLGKQVRFVRTDL